MDTLTGTPSANRLHIGFFGRTNSGKSSLINAFTKQQVSIVSDIQGTTTDPVYKPMEISPLGPCMIIDTAGFSDESELSGKREEKTQLVFQKTDLAIIVLPMDIVPNAYLYSGNKNDSIMINNGVINSVFQEEINWYRRFKEKDTKVLFVINKADLGIETAAEMESVISNMFNEEVVVASAKSGAGIEKIKSALERLKPEDEHDKITGELVNAGDVVMLVMPQDKQAPKGRLILPQVQTIRELLDIGCTIISVTDKEMLNGLKRLKEPPKLIITDSQVFRYVRDNKPEGSLLTSFSVLFAAQKGDISYFKESAKAIDNLTEASKVLIAECCTHAPLSEDIGRVKIPGLLRKRIGQNLTIDVAAGTDFPEKVNEYDLIIQCGACMFNRKYVLSRVDRAREMDVPMTNYGIAIAYLTGIIDEVIIPNE